MRLIPVLAVLAVLALPAAAQTVTHSVEGRFGVTHEADARDGAGATRGLHQGRYTMTVRQPFDSGWYVGFSLSIATGNFQPRGPAAWRDIQPGLRLNAPGS